MESLVQENAFPLAEHLMYVSAPESWHRPLFASMYPTLDGETLRAGTVLGSSAYQPSSVHSALHIQGIQYVLNDI